MGQAAGRHDGVSMTRCAELFDPDWLAERAVGGDVPNLEADPLRALRVHGNAERLARERSAIAEIQPLTVDAIAIAPDHLRKSRRAGPLNSGFDLGGRAAGKAQRLAALLAAHSELGQQDLPGADKEPPVAQGIEDRLPPLVKAGKPVQLEVIDVHVAIEFVVRHHLEY